MISRGSVGETEQLSEPANVWIFRESSPLARPLGWRLPVEVLWLSLLFVALVMPGSWWDWRVDGLWALPLELAVFGVLLLLPGLVGRGLRGLAAALLAVRVTLILADSIAYQAFARPFNPILDAYLLADAMNLLNGVLGDMAALAIAGAAATLLVAMCFGAFWLLERVRRPVAGQRTAVWAAVILVAAAWAGLRAVESPRATLRFYEHLAHHVRHVHASGVDLREFRGVLASQPEIDAAAAGFLQRLRGKDVLFVFIESYGRTLLEKPEFAEQFAPFLVERQARLERAGIEVRSAYLTSPTVGGLSWLAHATAMSGLWIDSQVRYDNLVASGHQSLNRLFREAGWRAVGVMPAITMAWPEGGYYGYDQLYHAHNAGYKGRAFNWVTMPDQYTLAAFHRHELAPVGRAPVMAEIALISSHAPWTPVPTRVAWDAVGDGRIFGEQATAGDPPEVVWRDPARIRRQYQLAVEYSVDTLIDYLITHADQDWVVLVLGDHQPAPLITSDGMTGEGASRDVPVHLFTRDTAVLDAVTHWGWSEGLLPAADGPVWAMSQVRPRLLQAMSAPP